jgi:hypothetical protein
MDDINTPSPQWEHAEEVRRLPRLLMKGTRELRKDDVAAEYIPQEADEDEGEWRIRVQRSVIFPFFRRAVGRAVNSILAKPMVLAEDVPELIAGVEGVERDGYWEDIDLEGHDGNTFWAAVLKDAIGESGISHVLVEFPTRPEGATGADTAGLRPYNVHIKDAAIIHSRAEVVAGRKRLAEVRIREHGKDDAGETVEQVRQLLAGGTLDAEGNPIEFVRWLIWRDMADGQARDANGAPIEDWRVIEEGLMSPHVDIPLSTLRINSTGWMAGETPFEDLAHLNILHTQKYSDTSENIRVTSGAQLHRTGITKEEAYSQRAIGAKRLLWSEPPEATAEWLERSGSGAAVADADLKRLEDRMDAISNEPHVRRTGDETATGRAIDASEARTEVQAWSIAVRDHVEEAFGFWAVYLGEATGGSVEVPMPPRWSEHGVDGLRFLAELYEATGLPRAQTILEEAQRLGYLSDGVDIEAEVQGLEPLEPLPVKEVTPVPEAGAEVEEGT